MKNQTKNYIILAVIVIAIVSLVLYSSQKKHENKNTMILGKDKSSNLFSLSEIKSICKSSSLTLQEGVLDYKEKSTSPSDEFWQWNPKLVEASTISFANEKGPVFVLDVVDFGSREEAMKNYDESYAQNKENMQAEYEKTPSPKEFTVADMSIGDNSSLIAWSEGYGTESSPQKNKSNMIIFVKGNRFALIADALCNITPEVPLNCTQEELIKVGELVVGRI